MADRPDFVALHRKRDEAVAKIVEALCAKQAWDPAMVFFHMSLGGCYCACPDGPCEHEFDGWREFEDGCGGEQVCRHCGMGAMAHSMRCVP